MNRRRSALALAVVLVTACGGGSYRIERTVGGEVRSGSFVPPFAYEHYVRGELALASGDFVAAVQELELARSGADDDPLLCARLATARHGAGDAAGAARAIDEGLALDPQAEAVLLAAGAIDEANGDTTAALARYEAAVAAAPASLSATEALVSLLERLSDPARAAEVLARHEQPEQIEAAIRRALAVGAIDRAMTLRRLAGPMSRRVSVTIAERLSLAGRPVLAAEVLAPWMGSAPESGPERRVRIDTAIRLGERTEAEGLLAVPFEGDVEEELNDALALVALGEAAAALELASSARARAPSLRADVVLAATLLAVGRLEEAVALASAVPAGSSVSSDASAVLAEALDRAGLPALAADVLRPDSSSDGR